MNKTVTWVSHLSTDVAPHKHFHIDGKYGDFNLHRPFFTY